MTRQNEDETERASLRYDGRRRRSLERSKCARGEQGLPTLDLQRHELYFQADLLSFGLRAFEFDHGSLLKLGILGAAMRKFGIVDHAIGRNAQDRRLLDHLADSRHTFEDH
jgi:hypothetical protein